MDVRVQFDSGMVIAGHDGKRGARRTRRVAKEFCVFSGLCVNRCFLGLGIRVIALSRRRSAELLGESDKKSFRTADVAKAIRVLILDYFAHELRAAVAEPLERFVDVVHGEHDA